MSTTARFFCTLDVWILAYNGIALDGSIDLTFALSKIGNRGEVRGVGGISAILFVQALFCTLVRHPWLATLPALPSLSGSLDQFQTSCPFLFSSLLPYTQPQELRRRSQRGGNRVQRGTAFGRHFFAPGVSVPNRLALRVHRRGSGERCFLPLPSSLRILIIQETPLALQLACDTALRNGGRVSCGITYLEPV